MPPRSSPSDTAGDSGAIGEARCDRLVPVGLSSDELDLVSRAARGQWTIAAVVEEAPINVLATSAHDTILVASMRWVESASQLSAFEQALREWYGVILVDATM